MTTNQMISATIKDAQRIANETKTGQKIVVRMVEITDTANTNRNWQSCTEISRYNSGDPICGGTVAVCFPSPS